MTGKAYTLPAAWELTIGEWCGYLSAAGHSRATLRTRRGAVRYIARVSGCSHPSQLGGDWLVAHCGAQDWSTDHRRTVRASLRSFYEYCQRATICADNPALDLPRAPESRPQPRPVTDSVWAQLLNKADTRERLMARLAAEAGLRRAEVARVHRDDLIEDIGGWSLIVRGKGARQRIVPLTDSLAAELQQYRIGYTPAGFVFPGQDDGHLSPGAVGKIVGALMPPGWSMHKLRHRFASRGYAGTGNLRAVQEALGHASVATTQRYTAVSGRDVRAVSESAA